MCSHPWVVMPDQQHIIPYKKTTVLDWGSKLVLIYPEHDSVSGVYQQPMLKQDFSEQGHYQ